MSPGKSHFRCARAALEALLASLPLHAQLVQRARVFVEPWAVTVVLPHLQQGTRWKVTARRCDVRVFAG
jgi:hypothetical protein